MCVSMCVCVRARACVPVSVFRCVNVFTFVCMRVYVSDSLFSLDGTTIVVVKQA